MMYYTTVSGWMVTYFYKFLIGEFQAGMDAEAAGAVFSNLLADPLQMSFWMILTVDVYKRQVYNQSKIKLFR